MWMIWEKQKELRENRENGKEPDIEMGRKVIQRDLADSRRRSATRGTLTCIFVCGSLLLGLGITLLCVGTLVPQFKEKPMPWLVTGPTCVVLGVLVLLLSVEIIMKLRKIASAESSDDSGKDNSWSSSTNVEKDKVAPFVPNVGSNQVSVVVQPPTPILLDAAQLNV